MNDKLITDIEDALLTIKNIRLIPKTERVKIHDVQYTQCLNLVKENFKDFFVYLTEKEFKYLLTQYDGKYVHFDGVENLESIFIRCVVPRVSENPSIEHVLENLEKIYMRQDEVIGALELLTPILSVYNDVINRARSIYKAIAVETHEWEGECMFEVFIPKEISAAHSELKKLVCEFEMRLSRFTEAYKILSRMYSVKMGVMSDDGISDSKQFTKPNWSRKNQTPS